MIEANDPKLQSFISVPADHDFPIQNLPFGIFSTQANQQKRVGVAIGDYVVDLAALAEAHLLDDIKLPTSLYQQPNLNALMAEGRKTATTLRNAISKLLRHDNPALQDNVAAKDKALVPMKQATLHLPVAIGGYTDFYSSKEHASNIGAMFRDKDNPLLPNWVHIPVGYDGRAASVIVSGQNFHRPKGQIKPDPDSAPVYEPCKGLDVEVEMGFFVGAPSKHGDAISMKNAPDHIFGMVLVNDWSARDIQKWEYVPLGPFLAKNFATSISPWVVTLDALEPFRVASPKQDPKPLSYLQRKADWAVDVQLELAVQTNKMTLPETIAKTNFKHMYWDMCQQLAHHSVNGCPMNTGDLLASGTISGQEKDSFGSLIELTWGGKNPIKLANGEERKFLQDGDSAIIKGFCQGDGYRVGFGEVRATILPAKK